MRKDTRTESADVAIIQRFLSNTYGITVSEVQEVVRGVNRTFSVRTYARNVFYLRLYRQSGRTSLEIAAELDLLKAIEENEFFSVARPVADLQGRYASQLKLSDQIVRTCALFHTAQGRSLEMIIGDMQAAGRALAYLHSQPALVEIAPRRDLADPHKIEATLAEMSAHPVANREIAQRIKESISHLYASSIDDLNTQVGFCHGDFRDANMRIDGARITLFDFDDCGTGPQWLDLATMGLWLEISGRSDAALLWSEFVSAYSGTLTEDPAFKRTMSLLIAYNELRSIQFLLSYCKLEDALWSEVFNRADETVARAVNGELRIYVSSL